MVAFCFLHAATLFTSVADAFGIGQVGDPSFIAWSVLLEIISSYNVVIFIM